MLSLAAFSLFIASHLSVLHPSPPLGASQATDLLVIQCAGTEGLFVDERDAGLRALLELLDERLAELPADFDGEFDLPPDALPLAARLIMSPMSLRIGSDDAAQDFPFYAELRCEQGSEEGARASVALASRVMTELGMEPGAPDANGLRPLPVPLPATLGPDGLALALTVGTPPVAAPVLRPTHLPDGVAPALAVQADLGALLALISMEPEARPIVDMLAQFGLAEATLSWAMGFGENEGFTTVALEGCVSAMQEKGFLSAERLTAESLRPVPVDASWANVSIMDLQGIWQAMLTFAQSQGLPQAEIDDFLATFERELGIQLERDLLAPLGNSIGMYASDSTGGGGLMSGVLYMEVEDPERLSTSLDTLESRLNAMARDELRGYVQVRHRSIDGAEIAALTFPGMPIPLEPSWALAYGHLVIGATPQAVEAALLQIAGGRSDLGASPHFQRALPEGCEGALSLTYIDSPRYVREGYGLASLAMSALTNAMRSRNKPDQLPGPALPSYRTLVEGARAYVSTSRVVGETLLVETRYDRSWSVNFASGAGYISSLFGGAPMLMIGPGLLGALMVPRVTQAVALAEMSKTRVDLIGIASASEEFYINNGGVWPESLELLITPDENGNRYLQWQTLPLDQWGREYLYQAPSPEEVRPRIYTLGRDGVEGGFGEDRDIDNWMIEDGEY